jgi:hypothetical protein
LAEKRGREGNGIRGGGTDDWYRVRLTCVTVVAGRCWQLAGAARCGSGASCLPKPGTRIWKVGSWKTVGRSLLTQTNS